MKWVRSAPLFPVALGLIVGIVADRYLPIPSWVHVAVFLVVNIVACPPRIRATVGVFVIFIAASCVGGLLHVGKAQTIPVASIERAVRDSGRIVRARGTVISPPQRLPKPEHEFSRWTYGVTKTAFLLAVDSVEGHQGFIHATGRIRVTVGDGTLGIQENDRVELFGRLFSLQPPMNPGSFDWADFYRRQGIVAQLRCEHDRNAVVLEQPSHATFGRMVSWLRRTARGLLIDDLTTGATEESGLLEAMVLGHRSQLDRRLNDIFTRSGCIHFLAASGTNVVILIGFVWFFARLFRQTKTRCAALMIVAVLIYALIADPRPPILRATVMTVIFCLAFLLGRTTSHLNSVSCSAIVLLLRDPDMLFDIGLQLSFAAVLGVVYVSATLKEAYFAARGWIERRLLNRPFADDDRQILRALAVQDRTLVGRIRGSIQWAVGLAATALAACFGAWLASFPIGAFYFQRIQPWGAINSALVYLLFSAAMFLGFLKMVLGMISPTLASFVGLPLRWLDSFLLGAVDRMAALPGASLNVSATPFWLVGLYYGTLLIFVIRFLGERNRRRGLEDQSIQWSHSESRPKTWRSRACALMFVALAAGVTLWLQPKVAPDRLTVTALAVGRGSATLIELPGGQTLLYDAGTSFPSDVGRNTITPFLRHSDIARIEGVYISHANLDHFSGLPSVLDEVTAGPLLLNRYFEPSSPAHSPAQHFLAVLSQRGHPVEQFGVAPLSWESGGVTFELLWPPAGLDDTWSANNTSTVLRLTFASRSILLTGDIEEEAQQALIQRGDLHADVLFLPHHGSVAKTLKSFLVAVNPQIVIRSHFERMRETTNGLEDIVGSIPIYNTADHGAVEIRVEREGIRVIPMIPPSKGGT